MLYSMTQKKSDGQLFLLSGSHQNTEWNFKSFFISNWSNEWKWNLSWSKIFEIFPSLPDCSPARMIKDETKRNSRYQKQQVNFCEQLKVLNNTRLMVFAISRYDEHWLSTVHIQTLKVMCFYSSVFLDDQWNECVIIPTAYWSTVSETETNIDKTIIIMNTVSMSSLLSSVLSWYQYVAWA